MVFDETVRPYADRKLKGRLRPKGCLLIILVSMAGFENRNTTMKGERVLLGEQNEEKRGYGLVDCIAQSSE